MCTWRPSTMGHVTSRARRTFLMIMCVLLGALSIAVFSLAGITKDPTAQAAIATAGATLALAAVAVLTFGQQTDLLEANRSLVEMATKEVAEARAQTEALLASVDESRREREWAYKPLLITTYRVVPDPMVIGRRFVVTNVGRGPALNVRLCAHEMSGEPLGHEWASGHLDAIAPGASEEAWATMGQDQTNQRYRCVVDDLVVQEPKTLVTAVAYEDWFHTHYRQPGSHADAFPVEWWGEPSVVDAPDWLRCS